MRQLLEKRNFYKQINENRVVELINVYEALCEVAYDPKGEHRCWTAFIEELGYNLNINVLQIKAKVDDRIEWLIRYIDEALDKSQND